MYQIFSNIVQDCLIIYEQLPTLMTDIFDCEEFRAFDPGIHPTRCWWGWETMRNNHSSDECRNARLLAIAFMLTMPEDMRPKIWLVEPE